MKKVLIIDCNALGWGAFHSMPDLSFDEHGTAIIYGFLNKLFLMQEIFMADDIVFAWDDHRSKRTKLFPEYKIKRKTTAKEYTDEEQHAHTERARQFKLLYEDVLPTLGFVNNFKVKGLEGDDIIASIALEQRKDKFVRIVASDGDLYQLLNDNCSMYSPVTRAVTNEETFFTKYGIYPDMWAEVKTLWGCPGDDVPGIKGIGVDRAIKFLLGDMKSSSVLYKRILQSDDIKELTRKLVVLPFEGTPQFKLKKDTCKINKLKRVARRYGLNTYMSSAAAHEFQEYFCRENKKNTNAISGNSKKKKGSPNR